MNDIQIHKNFNQTLESLRFKSIQDVQLFHIYDLQSIIDINKVIQTPSFRQYFFDIGLFLDADFDYCHSFHKKRITKNTLQIVPPRQVQQISAAPENIQLLKGYTIYFLPEFLSMSFENSNVYKDFPFFSYSNQDCLLNLTVAETKQIKKLMVLILNSYVKKGDFHQEVIRGYLWALLNLVKRVWLRKNDTQSPTPESLLVANFDTLVSQNIDASVKIIDYANKLCLTPNTLHTTYKSETGKTPKQFVDITLCNEAKTLLALTELSVADIAYHLNFSEPTHFTRFFKRMTGFVPSKFQS